MTAEQYARIKAQDPRYRGKRFISEITGKFSSSNLISTTGSSTLPRPTTKATEADLIRSDKPATTASTTSLYDNVASGNQGQGQQGETKATKVFFLS